MFVFGGYNDNGQVLNDLQYFDGKSWHAKMLCVPLPALAHAAMIVHQNCVLICGGINEKQVSNKTLVIDISTGSWSSFESEHAARMEHYMFEHQGKVYVVGGNNQCKACNTICCLEQKEWKQVELETSFEWRKGARYLYSNNVLYEHGGTTQLAWLQSCKLDRLEVLNNDILLEICKYLRPRDWNNIILSSKNHVLAACALGMYKWRNSFYQMRHYGNRFLMPD